MPEPYTVVEDTARCVVCGAACVVKLEIDPELLALLGETREAYIRSERAAMVRRASESHCEASR